MASTVEEIARRANVAPSTVYQVLRTPENERYTLATRKRILRTARELHFFPHSAGRALARGKCQTIGLFSARWDDPHLQKALVAATSCVAEHEHDLLLTNDVRVRAWHRILLERKADLLITVGLGHDPGENFEALLKMKDRIAVVGPRIEPIFRPVQFWSTSAVWDDQVGAASVADHLLELGHRELAVIGGEEVTVRVIGFVRRAIEAGARPWVVLSRQSGLDSYQQHLAHMVEDRVVFTDEPSSDDLSVIGSRQLAALLQVAPQTTAVFCRNDRVASGAINRAQAMGLSVPASISIAGYCDELGEEAVLPKLTTVRTPIAKAVRDVLDRFFTSESDEQGWGESRVLHTELIQRDSTAPPTRE